MPRKVLRVFLDANVLFSAAYRQKAGLLSLWDVPGAEILTSGYAAEEARRNLSEEAARSRLEQLLEKTTLVAEAVEVSLPSSIRLPAKDQPILQAAIAAEATHLVTGDLRDFGLLLGRRIAGVQIQTPADFLRGHRSGRG